MSTNAHFLHAAQLLTPGASYTANLVLPDAQTAAELVGRVVDSAVFGADWPVVLWLQRDGGFDVDRKVVADVRPFRLPGNERPNTVSILDAAIAGQLLAAAFDTLRSVPQAFFDASISGPVPELSHVLSLALYPKETPGLSIKAATPTARFRPARGGWLAMPITLSR